MTCLIVGDSIAMGIGMYDQHCATKAQTGISSIAWNHHWLVQNIDSDHVIISLGSNDWSASVTGHELNYLRDHITAARITWIIPAIKPAIRTVVETIANAHGDGKIDLLGIPLSPDHVHPTGAGYAMIVKQLN